MQKAVLTLLFAMGIASMASAQPAPDSRFSVGLTGGVGTGGHHDAGGAIGASFAVRLGSRVDTEFEGTYADRGPGVDALALEGRLRIALLPRDARVVPQLTFGAGAYRSEFAMGGRDMFGTWAQMGPGRFTATPYGGMMPGAPGAYRGSMWSGLPGGPVNMPQIPMFYARRLGDVAFGPDGRIPSRTFTDPAAVFGGGVTFNATRSLYVRPEARALLVIGDGDTYTVGFVTVQMGFRF